ncbi:hypothetical protein GCM10010522_23560 [Kribbella solani]|uniref:Uncharacterized protein n=1 Tax=Kribbella solani TaxID=236067 RepID=A0A841DPE5_9ACTN|nr:hypothetical protein [Kribbella solani]
MRFLGVDSAGPAALGGLTNRISVCSARRGGGPVARQQPHPRGVARRPRALTSHRLGAVRGRASGPAALTNWSWVVGWGRFGDFGVGW